METPDTIHTHTFPYSISDDTDESQFNEPWDPRRDDLTRIVNIGYTELGLNAKNLYNIIIDLTKMDQADITDKMLADTPYYNQKSDRTLSNGLSELTKAELISRNKIGEITLLEPNARNKDFQAYILSTQ